MHTLAKRLYNVSPGPVRLALADGTTVTFEVESAEFFRESFQGEGRDEDGTAYRLISEGDDDPPALGRERGDGWELVGQVADVTTVEE